MASRKVPKQECDVYKWMSSVQAALPVLLARYKRGSKQHNSISQQDPTFVTRTNKRTAQEEAEIESIVLPAIGKMATLVGGISTLHYLVQEDSNYFQPSTNSVENLIFRFRQTTTMSIGTRSHTPTTVQSSCGTELTRPRFACSLAATTAVSTIEVLRNSTQFKTYLGALITKDSLLQKVLSNKKLLDSLWLMMPNPRQSHPEDALKDLFFETMTPVLIEYLSCPCLFAYCMSNNHRNKTCPMIATAQQLRNRVTKKIKLLSDQVYRDIFTSGEGIELSKVRAPGEQTLTQPGTTTTADRSTAATWFVLLTYRVRACAERKIRVHRSSTQDHELRMPVSPMTSEKRKRTARAHDGVGNTHETTSFKAAKNLLLTKKSRCDSSYHSDALPLQHNNASAEQSFPPQCVTPWIAMANDILDRIG
jgi:hypothetical protein